MTRDELRVHIWERFCIVMPEVADPVQQTDGIMALVDTYSVGIVQDASDTLAKRPESELLAWLAVRK